MECDVQEAQRGAKRPADRDIHDSFLLGAVGALHVELLDEAFGLHRAPRFTEGVCEGVDHRVVCSNAVRPAGAATGMSSVSSEWFPADGAT